MNERYGQSVLIDEVYGSREESSRLAARPAFRLPRISRADFAKRVGILRAEGIAFNYTLNASTLGDADETRSLERFAKGYVSFLEGAGVDIVTVSCPLVAEWVRSVSTNMRIELSTIANVQSVSEVSAWHDLYRLSRACVSLSRNRDIPFLRSLSAACSDMGVEPVIMANEFCGIGIDGPAGRGGYSPCIYRNHCYALQSLGYGADDDFARDYPFSRCVRSRSNVSSWLKARFIRPEDMAKYAEIGISRFKVTGRTNPTAFTMRTVDAYAAQSFDGNLLDLWGGVGESFADTKKVIVIPNKSLDGFVDHWFDSDEYRCDDEICGVTCRYCDEYCERLGL